MTEAVILEPQHRTALPKETLHIAPQVLEEAAVLRFELQRAIEHCLFGSSPMKHHNVSTIRYRVLRFVRRQALGWKVFTYYADGSDFNHASGIWLLENGKLFDEGKQAVISIEEINPAFLRGVTTGVQALI